mgnify:CR=1 FL=1
MDLSFTTSKRMNILFYDARKANPDVSKWNVGVSTYNFNSFILDAILANPVGALASWNMHKVIALDRMFKNSVLNPDVSNWNTWKVLDSENGKRRK